MKKGIFLLLIILISFFLFSVSQTTNIAYAKNDVQEQLESEINDNLESLIDEDLNQYFINLENNLGFSLKDFVKGIISGEISISADTIITKLFDEIKEGIKSSLISLISILVLALLSSLSKNLTAGFKKDGIENIVHFAIYGAIICTLSITVGNIVKNTIDSLNGINSIIDNCFPIILTLLTAIGGVSAQSFLQPISVLLSNLLLKLIINLIIPIFCACTIFTFVGNLSDSIKLDKMNKTFKSIGNWLLVISFTIITTFVAIQGLVGASIDTISIKTAKFALSTYIPILGGYLAEGFDIVLASCVLIKNAFGLAVFLSIISLLFYPILKIILLSTSLKLISAIVEPIGENKVSALLYDTASSLNILIASLGGVAFLIFVILSLIIGAFNGGII